MKPEDEALAVISICFGVAAVFLIWLFVLTPLQPSPPLHPATIYLADKPGIHAVNHSVYNGVVSYTLTDGTRGSATQPWRIEIPAPVEKP